MQVTMDTPASELLRQGRELLPDSLLALKAPPPDPHPSAPRYYDIVSLRESASPGRLPDRLAVLGLLLLAFTLLIALVKE